MTKWPINTGMIFLFGNNIWLIVTWLNQKNNSLKQYQML